MFRSITYIAFLFSFIFAVNGQSGAAGSSGSCRPEIVPDTILDSVRVEGTLRMGPIEGRCLPMEKRPGSGFVYDPENGPRFTSTLRDSRGRTVNVFVWYGAPRLGGVQFSKYEILGGAGALEPLREGAYNIDFAIDGSVFQSFPFTLAVRDSRDPLRPGKIYLTDGTWRERAILTGSASTVTCLNFRLRADDGSAGFRPVKVPYSVKLVRLRDKRTIAETNEGQLTLDANWYTFRTCLGPPAGAAAGTVWPRLGDLLSDEGSYRIVLSVDGRHYADYDLEVRNGRLNGEPGTARTYRIGLKAQLRGR